MEAAPTLDTVLRHVGNQLEKMPRERRVKMLGILFCRPQLRIAKEELLPHLKYYHLRSGKFIDFFFVGFIPPKWVSMFNERQFMYEVDGPDGSTWLFDERHFTQWRETIEEKSNWRYSGGNDLLLVNARLGNQYCVAQIDLQSAMSVTLENIKKNERISEISTLFEKIFRYAESPNTTDPVSGFSNMMGAMIGKKALKDLFVSILPKPLQENAKAAFSYAIRDYRRVK